jgi:hypothetical protein
VNTDPKDIGTFAGSFGLMLIIIIALIVFGGKDDRK